MGGRAAFGLVALAFAACAPALGVPDSSDGSTRDALVPRDAFVPRGDDWTVGWGMGDPAQVQLTRAVVGRDGAVYAIGNVYRGAVDVGGVRYPAPTGSLGTDGSWLVLRIDPDGRVAWVRVLGPSRGPTVIAIGDDGALRVRGEWDGGAGGGWSRTVANGYVLATFGPDEREQRVLTQSWLGSVQSMTVLPGGDLVVAGGAYDATGSPPCAGARAGLFVARVHADLSCAWGRFDVGGVAYGDSDSADAMARGPDGTVCVTGSVTGEARMGEGSPLEGGAWIGCFDEGSGATRSQHAYYTSGIPRGYLGIGTPVVTDAGVYALVSAYTLDWGQFPPDDPSTFPPPDLGAGPLPFGVGALVRWDLDGTITWQRLDTDLGVSVGAIDTSETGGLVVAGSYRGTATMFGSSLLRSTTTTAAFVGELTSDGVPIRGRGFDTTGFGAFDVGAFRGGIHLIGSAFADASGAAGHATFAAPVTLMLDLPPTQGNGIAARIAW